MGVGEAAGRGASGCSWYEHERTAEMSDEHEEPTSTGDEVAPERQFPWQSLLSDEEREAIHRKVTSWPPLDDETLEKLRVILAPAVEQVAEERRQEARDALRKKKD